MGLFGFRKQKKEKTHEEYMDIPKETETLKFNEEPVRGEKNQEEDQRNSTAPKRILICDDAVFTLMVIKDILQKAGYQVVGEATNGKKALTQYQKLKPDLLILDITMPEMNGIEALKAIRKIDPAACVVMCPSIRELSIVNEAIQAGAKGFVVKPYNENDVLETLQKALQTC